MAGALTTQTNPAAYSRLRRCVATLSSLLLILTALLVAVSSDAGAVTPELLLGRNRVGEYQPVRSADYLAWQQNTGRNPGHYDVLARPIEGGESFKVNAAGTNGANGSIDDGVLVYQQFKRGRSDLKFFDLDDRSRTSPPSGVNTDNWEYWPSISDNWLLFARLYGNRVRRLVLFDLATGDSRTLATVRGNGSLEPGQVSGDWAVWSKCRQGVCDVFRYNISGETNETIPNSDTRQHAPSVSPDGTVYFARSNGRCGGGVRLITRPLTGDETVLWRISSGDDVGSTEAFVDRDGVTTVLFDQFDCDQAAQADAWAIGEDFTPELTVTLEGDAKGTVTSSPPGIDCGDDCTESYPAGTGVTLTADPKGGAEFGGWSGACSGTDETCTLTMNEAKSVIATFGDEPVAHTPSISGVATCDQQTGTYNVDYTIDDDGATGIAAGSGPEPVDLTSLTAGNFPISGGSVTYEYSDGPDQTANYAAVALPAGECVMSPTTTTFL